MIRRLVDQAFNSGKYYISAVGLSTDVKPTEGIITGSKFVEVDTGIGYLFDETSGEWHKNQQLTEAVQAYFEDHPEAIDQAAIEAMFGDQLDGIEEDIGGLKSAISDISTTTRNIFFGTLSNGNIGADDVVQTVPANFLHCNEYIPVDADTGYILSVYATTAFTQIVLLEYTSGKVLVTRRGIRNATSSTYHETGLTTGSTTAYVKLLFYNPNGDMTPTGNRVQLEKGNAVTEYIPHVVGFDAEARQLAADNKSSIDGKRCFELDGTMSNVFTDIQIISDNRYIITNARNNYNGVTGFVIYASDDSGSAITEMINIEGIALSGSMEIRLENAIISLTYDLSLIASGTRIIGNGLSFLISKNRYFNVAKSGEDIVVSVKTDGTGDFTSLLDAINYASRYANSNQWVRIEVYPGTYKINDYYTPQQWAVEDTSMIGLMLPDYCHLIGIGNNEDVIITGESETPRQYISTLNIRNTCVVENLSIKSVGLRYAMHDDWGSNNAIGNRIVKNCIFTQTNGYYGRAYGAGVRDRDTVKLENCVFDTNADDYSVSFHNNVDFTVGSEIIFNNCRCKANGINLITFANGANTIVVIDGTKASQLYLNRQSSDVGINFRVSGYANDITTKNVSYGNVDDYIDLI